MRLAAPHECGFGVVCLQLTDETCCSAASAVEEHERESCLKAAMPAQIVAYAVGTNGTNMGRF